MKNYSEKQYREMMLEAISSQDEFDSFKSFVTACGLSPQTPRVGIGKNFTKALKKLKREGVLDFSFGKRGRLTSFHVERLSPVVREEKFSAEVSTVIQDERPMGKDAKVEKALSLLSEVLKEDIQEELDRLRLQNAELSGENLRLRQEKNEMEARQSGFGRFFKFTA
jgi:hypothetical protein